MKQTLSCIDRLKIVNSGITLYVMIYLIVIHPTSPPVVGSFSTPINPVQERSH